MPEEYVGRKFRTEFVSSSVPNGALVDEILEASHRLNGRGLTPANGGNLSVRTKEGMLITVGGKNKGELVVGDVVEVVGFDAARLVARVRGRQEPSSETPMHWLIYRRYPKVNAVVHAHDYTVVGDHAKARRLNLKFTEREHPYGTLEQAREVVSALSGSDYVVILNHGVVSVGRNLEEAVRRIEEVYNL